jgi:NAD(P)-dependent dehydrogenase (short-subunit alcohol dehydrogenase family)
MEPAEAAALIRMLSGDASSYITGATVAVDGGLAIKLLRPS